MYLHKPPKKQKKTPMPLKRGTLKRSLGRKGKERLEGMAKARQFYISSDIAKLCRICYSFHDECFDLHHKLLRSRGGDESYVNLVPLCRRCHSFIHQTEGMIDQVHASSATMLNAEFI